jgi:hypothetical protein
MAAIGADPHHCTSPFRRVMPYNSKTEIMTIQLEDLGPRLNRLRPKRLDRLQGTSRSGPGLNPATLAHRQPERTGSEHLFCFAICRSNISLVMTLFGEGRLGSSSRNFSDQTRGGNSWPENVEQIVRAGQAAAQ